MVRSLLFVALSVLTLGPCSKKDGAGDAGSLFASATADGPKPPPPADAPTSCSALPPYKLADSSDGGTKIAYTMKNTGTKPWHYCNMYGFAYDKTGAIIASGNISDNTSLAPGATSQSDVTLRDSKGKPVTQAALAGATFELLPGNTYFDDKSEWEAKPSLFNHTKASGPTFTIGGAPAASAAPAPSAKPTATAKPAGKK